MSHDIRVLPTQPLSCQNLWTQNDKVLFFSHLGASKERLKSSAPTPTSVDGIAETTIWSAVNKSVFSFLFHTLNPKYSASSGHSLQTTRQLFDNLMFNSGTVTVYDSRRLICKN